MVKTVEGQHGIRAWQKLHKHYHRRTFAKRIRDHREILYPRPLKHMGEVVVAVTEWEDKVTKVDKAYEEISEFLKVAALVERMPTEIKDMIFMTSEENPHYQKLEQMIFAWAANKVSAQGGRCRWTSAECPTARTTTAVTTRSAARRWT